VVTVVEFDAASLRGPKAASNTPLGGIAVFGQRTVNGMVVHKFMATSLTLK